MVELDLKNIKKKKIGAGGLSDRVFSAYLKKQKGLIKDVWTSRNKEGAFLLLPDDRKTLNEINKFAKLQTKKKWENIVVLGIGGSTLGVTALRDGLLGSFYNLNKKPRLLVVDNIDPDYISELLKTISLKKTLFLVISKSGGTTEALVLYALIKEKLGKNAKDQMLFVTDPKKSYLRKIAKEEGIQCFDIPPKLGGRFSVLSPVGLLPAALVGIDTTALLRGARKMRDAIVKNNKTSNIALQLAATQYLLDKKKDKVMTVIMPYNNRLYSVADWYRQLLAESIGKNKKTGPTPIKALGTTDQHSQLQLYAEGPNNKFILFLMPDKQEKDLKTGKTLTKPYDYLNQQKLSTVLNAAYTGTAQSLAKKGRPNATLKIPKIDAENMGALFMLLEYQVALLGKMYRVNAYNQPGVEEGKLITKKILSKEIRNKESGFSNIKG